MTDDFSACRRRTSVRACCVGLAIFVCGGWASSPRADDPPGAASAGAPGTFEQVVRPFLATYCTSCHGEKKQSGSLTLHNADLKSLQNERANWETVVQKLRGAEMPPKDKPQPTAEERKKVVAWIEAELAKYVCTGPTDPGRVT